ncbi:hypothetical protein IAT38_006373 [Cryptococcus sp. DSM 104549]
MDLSYNAVAASCADQMAKYQECVLKNSAGDWNTICRPYGQALAACADNAVPHLAELKAACAEPIATYRKCLDKHASQDEEVIGEKCGPLMKQLWECSERTVAAIEARDGGKKLV